MDYGSILESIAKWLSSGPVGIIAGLLGLGGISFAVYALAKRIKESQFQSSLNNAAAAAGEDSGSASDGMKENTKEIEEAIALEQLKQVPTIAAPKTIKVRDSFTVVTTGIPDKTPVYADKKFIIGFILKGSLPSIVLTVKGERTIDVCLNDVWYSTPITVE